MLNKTSPDYFFYFFVFVVNRILLSVSDADDVGTFTFPQQTLSCRMPHTRQRQRGSVAAWQGYSGDKGFNFGAELSKSPSSESDASLFRLHTARHAAPRRATPPPTASCPCQKVGEHTRPEESQIGSAVFYYPGHSGCYWSVLGLGARRSGPGETNCCLFLGMNKPRA